MRSSALLLAALSLPALLSGQSSRTACALPVAIDSVSLMRNVFRIADDSMRGRERGSPGAIKARDYFADQFKSVGLTPMGSSFVHPVKPAVASPATDGLSMANVIGMVKGTANPDQYIVVTGHYDHVGVGRPLDGDSIFNGADDNASGSVALIELARHFVKSPPRHSVIFAAVDAEERGMVGSRAFVNAPMVPLDQILLNVNMDMIGRNEKGELYASGTRHTPALKPLVEATAACAPVTLLMGHDDPAQRRDDWTSQSDHGSFHAKGIPFVYFGVEDHPDYHKPGDSPDRLMPGFYVGAVRTVGDFILRFDAKPLARVKSDTH